MNDFRTVLRFIVVGLANTLIALTLIFLAKGVFGFGDAAANGLGYAVGLSVGFVLNRNWTFRHSGSIARSLPTFLLVQGAAYTLNLICVLALVEHGVNGYWAQVLGIPPYTLVSYFGSRWVAFTKTHAKKLS